MVGKRPFALAKEADWVLAPSLAPSVFDGPIAVGFLAHVTQFLVPTLRPSDVVIIDSLGSYKGKIVRRAIRAAGAHLLFLPLYSPDLDPIERVFAKLKTRYERQTHGLSNRPGKLLAHS
jgi:transposase